MIALCNCHFGDAGEAETIFQKAILEQGRGRVLDTLAEIQERNRAVKDLEASLLELHQIFLDMAVLVEAQGEMLDNIEKQVGSLVGMYDRQKLTRQAYYMALNMPPAHRGTWHPVGWSWFLAAAFSMLCNIHQGMTCSGTVRLCALEHSSCSGPSVLTASALVTQFCCGGLKNGGKHSITVEVVQAGVLGAKCGCCLLCCLQVARSVEYVQSGTVALQDAKMLQKKTRKWMCCAIILLLVTAAIIVIVVSLVMP